MLEKERRRYFRTDFKKQVQLNFPTGIYGRCHVKNISLGGMFVKGNLPHMLERQCYVSFPLTDKPTYFTFIALAQVVRHDDEWIVLRFISMSSESLQLLKMIIRYELEEKHSDAGIKLPQDLPFKIHDDVSFPSTPDEVPPFYEWI